MVEAEEPQHQHRKDRVINILHAMKISYSIWPPTQRTRDAVIERLVETLTAPSILSNRYGSIPAGEASATACLIEEDAFSAASASATAVAASDAGGIEILQSYSKEISKRMLEAVKSKAAVSGEDNASQTAPVTSEEFSSVKTESY